MPNSPYITPGFLLQEQRYNNSLPPSSFDPNYMVDPSQALQAQQQYLKQMFAMQNPRLMLPQQFGQAIGNAIAGGQPQSQGAPSGPGPTDPVAAAIHQKAVAYGAQGMDAGAALYKAAGDIEQDPRLGASPTAEKYIEKARSYAIKTMGYSPEQEAQRSFEKTKLPYDNIRLPTGKVVAAQVGTPEYKAYMEAGGVKAGDAPQIPVGERKQTVRNGLNVEEQYNGGDKGWQQVPGSASTTPATYGVNANLSGPDAQTGAAAFGRINPKVWDTGSAAQTTKELTDKDSTAKAAVDAIDNFKKLINANPAAAGKSGDILEAVNEGRSTISALSGVLKDNSAYTLTPDTAKKLAPMVDRFRKAGIDATALNSAATNAAYAIEAAMGNGGDMSSRKGFVEQIKSQLLGDNSSDPIAASAAADQTKNQLIRSLSSLHDAKPDIMDRPAWLEKEVYKSPADVRAAYKAGYLTRPQATRILKQLHGFSE